jgi:uncharacterized protein YfbU (UPF0304 family)
MKELINAVQISLQTKNWHAALFVALALPDICSKLECPNSKKSQGRYITWFNRYLSDKYIHEVGADHQRHVFLTGEDCYALRCAYLHEGSDEITEQTCQQVLNNFKFTTDLSHLNYINNGDNKTLQLQVETFCKEICTAVGQWLRDVSTNNEVQNRISKMLKIHDSIFTKDKKGYHIP